MEELDDIEVDVSVILSKYGMSVAKATLTDKRVDGGRFISAMEKPKVLSAFFHPTKEHSAAVNGGIFGVNAESSAPANKWAVAVGVKGLFGGSSFGSSPAAKDASKSGKGSEAAERAELEASFSITSQPNTSVGIPSSGTATFLTAVKVRREPSVSGKEVAVCSKGEKVNYDKVVKNECGTWISYIGSSKKRNYCCAIDIKGEQYVSAGSTLAPPPSSPPSPPPKGSEANFTQTAFKYAAVKSSGSLFCCCCYLGGLSTQTQCDDAVSWCMQQKYVSLDLFDCYVNINHSELADKLSKHYGTMKRAGVAENVGDSCHYAVTLGGKEIYNPVYLGYRKPKE